jgi:Tfp pilus assembly protein PilV
MRRVSSKPNARGSQKRGLRRGVTLAEVVVAFALLGGVVLSFATFTQRFTHNTSQASTRSTASDLAVERLESVKSAATYVAIDAMIATEPTIPGFAGFARQTYVRRTLSSIADHKTVTVVVRNRSLGDSIVKTTVIPSF